MTTSRFTDRLWQDIAPIYDAILAHPFLAELADGSLSRERFVFYMQQDALYLQDFARALGLAGVRSPDVATVQAYLDFGSVAVTVESGAARELLRGVRRRGSCREGAGLLRLHELPARDRRRRVPTPKSVAALLPCFWIYREVGNHIYGTAAEGLEAQPLPPLDRDLRRRILRRGGRIGPGDHEPRRRLGHRGGPRAHGAPPSRPPRGSSGSSGTAPTAWRPGCQAS